MFFVMKLNILLKYLLKEATSWSDTHIRTDGTGPEAPKNSSLGQYLFAPERFDTPEPQEPNTDLENTLLKDLGRFYNGGGDPSLDKSLVKLLKFSKQGKYSKLLKPPSGLAYRFVGNIKPEEASSLFLNDLPVKEIVSKPNQAFYVSPVGIIENPSAKSSMGKLNTKMSSWTIDPTLPRMAGFASSGPGHVSVVLVANIQSNNFFMNPENLSKSLANGIGISLPKSTIEDELEVIGYGPINVLEAAAIYIGSGEADRFRSETIQALPKINFSRPAGSRGVSYSLPAELFKKQLDYVNGAILAYAPYQIRSTIYGSDTYKQLKVLAAKGSIVEAGSYKEQTMAGIALDVLYFLFSSVEKSGPNVDVGIQNNLLNAILTRTQLKTEKHHRILVIYAVALGKPNIIAGPDVLILEIR